MQLPSLAAASTSRLISDAAELMLAADAARYSGHPAEAAKYLQAVIDKHATNSRAPLAAYTLGGMYLRTLKDPPRAAELFAKARALAPNGALAADALAREVEARFRAGDPARARTLAEEYLSRYPNGSAKRAVKRHGGIE